MDRRCGDTCCPAIPDQFSVDVNVDHRQPTKRWLSRFHCLQLCLRIFLKQPDGRFSSRGRHWGRFSLRCGDLEVQPASSKSVPAKTVPLPLIFVACAIDSAICRRDWFSGIPRVVPLLRQTTALPLLRVLVKPWMNLALTSQDALKSHLLAVEKLLKRTPWNSK